MNSTNFLSARRPRRIPRNNALSAIAIATVAASAILGGLAAAADRGQQADEKKTTDPALQGMEWREVGPYRGGRSAAVAGIPSQPQVYYFGSTGGGVWKTDDSGRSWSNISDGFFGGSIGAVAVSEWDPNVIYVGGGEKTLRGNVSHGDGMWKSTDAGRTWQKIGLDDSRHVSRIRIDPKNPDRVWVAVMGHLFGANPTRGIFRSDNGGKTWDKIKFVDDRTGCVDLALDPTNPRILYASFWQVHRTPYSLESGGEGSGLWKSTDGGENWTELTRNEGLPKGVWGISGIAVSPTAPDNLYAIVEAEEGGVFRSRDAGKTWSRTNDERKLRQRAWYYSRIYADPADAEGVYVLNVRFHKSKDGGRRFQTISTPHGDNHDLWIDPGDPLRMIESNDGGANVTKDGGQNWSPQDNQPTAQFYRVSVDNDFPYRLLGGQQDNSAVRIRHRSPRGSAIGERDWMPTAGGESGHVVADPSNPEIVYGGSYGGFLMRVNHATDERRAIDVWPDNPMGWGAEELKYRFNWNFPIAISPHDSNTLYAAANVLFRSRDAGESWEAISGDLTRNDKSRQASSGGPITQDNTSVEYYGTIFAIVESQHEPGVLWTASDDGLIQLSRDAGKSWTNVSPKGIPAWILFNSVEIHPFEAGGLYVAGTRYKSDDFEPYLYRTTDYGKTWKRIDRGIPRAHFTRVVRADPDRRGLLYAGTEAGVYMSMDDGANWRSLQLQLPIVPITDLAVHQGDLIAATQGRGFWILDDLTPLQHYRKELGDAPAQFMPPRPAYRLAAGSRPNPENMGTNPASGVVFRYRLAQDLSPETAFKLEFFDGSDEPIRTFTRKPAEEEKKESEDRPKEEDLRLLESKAGLQSLVWNMRYAEAKRFPGMVLWNSNLDGPRAVPGDYRARLTVGDWSDEVSFAILKDPRSSATDEDFRKQFEFLTGVRDEVTEVHRAIGKIRDLTKQVGSLKGRIEKMYEGDEDELPPLVAECKRVEEELSTIEKALYQTKLESRQDPLNFPIRLNDKLAGLLGLASFGDFAPTASMRAVRAELTAAIDAQLTLLDGLTHEAIPELNRSAGALSVAPIWIPEDN